MQEKTDAIVTVGDAQKVVQSIKKQLKDSGNRTLFSGLLLPKYVNIISKRYTGHGRPKNSDYDRKKIDWSKIATSILAQ